MSANLKVFCAGAVKAPLTVLAQTYERETGQSIQFTFGAAGSLQARVVAGEPVDIVILTRPALSQLESDGKLRPGTIADLGRVGVGIAVRADAPSPDVSTPDALRKTLIAAKSLSYGDPAMGDSSGIHFASVLTRLNIAREIDAKTILAPAGLGVVELVENGSVEMGATQASVILARKGVKLAGLLPADAQHITTYSVAIVAAAAAVDAAERFVAGLTTASARATFAKAGFD